MMTPIQLRIRRKTLVPVNGIVHKFRSDWVHVGKISYVDAHRLFKRLGGGPILYDYEFAKFLYDNFGEGIYSVLAWKRRHSPFWGFFMVELRDNGFMRLKKSKSSEQRDNEKLKRRMMKMKKTLNNTTNVMEKMRTQEELDDLLEESDMNRELIEIERELTKSGPYPYLIQTHPVYRFHSYNQSTIINNTQEGEKEVSPQGF